MKTKILKKPWIWPCVASVSTFLILLPLSRLDYDSHHDGIMIASAVAQRQGYFVHGEAFAQYGPVSTWIQSLFLYLGQPAAVTLRILNVLIISLTVFFIADLGRQTKKSIQISQWTTISAATMWVMLNDVFNWVPILPWSSAIAQLLVVLGLYMFFRGITCDDTVITINSRIHVIFAGFMWGLIIFTRVNVGLILVGFIIFLWLIVECFLQAARGAMRHLLIGLVLSIAFVLLTLLVTDSLTQWWSQAIVWPANWSSTIYSRSGMFMRFQTMFESMSFEMFIALTVIFALGSVSLIQSQNRIGIQSMVLIVSAGLLFLFAWRTTPTVWAPSTVPNDLIKFANMRVNFLSLFFWLGIVTSFWILVTETLELLNSRVGSAKRICRILLLLVATAGTVQILPVSDSRHFWWGMPLVIVVLFHFASRVITSPWIRIVSFTAPLIFVSIATIQLLPGYLQIPRTSAPTGSVAEGMLMRSEKNIGVSEFDVYVANFELLRTSLRSDDQIVFLVRNGDVSVFDGEFHSVDINYVAWGPVGPFIPRAENANVVVLDSDVVSAFQPEMFLLGFESVAKNEHLAIWRR